MTSTNTHPFTVDDDTAAVHPRLRLSSRARQDLGFDDVMAVLRGLCKTELGREGIVDDVFAEHPGTLEERLATAIEAKAAVSRHVSPDFAALREIRHILEASDKGVVLAAVDILDVARTMEALGRLKDVVAIQGDDAPTLVGLAEMLQDERRFARRVLRSFDESGALTDDASPELSTRRSRVRQLRAEAQERLGDLVREYDDLELLQDRNFTIRNDRYVLPVKSSFQAKVEGIVHDASQTHQTVFIEPKALLQLGNRIKIARAEVVEEEQRILAEFSEEIAEHAPRLSSDLRLAGLIEAAFARGTFAFAIDGEAIPVRGNGGSSAGGGDRARRTLTLSRARHPLLAWIRFEAQRQASEHGRRLEAVGGNGGDLDKTPAPKIPDPVIPNDIRLDGAACLVVSGPNAGGKTVALKTAGLIALMARAGLPVPADTDSIIPAFAGVSVSIGDEQSLQGGFSSFSGHLSAVKAIVDDVEADLRRGPALVLLDELMSGTDPAQGAALAQALLEDLVDTRAPDRRGRCSIIVTTHYDRLKALALAAADSDDVGDVNTPRAGRLFRNASVGTDVDGRPTFRLILDEVGTSNAFEAARRFGVKTSTIERALALLAPEQKELHALLRSLAEGKQHLEAKVSAAEEARVRFAEESQRLEGKLLSVENERNRLRREGKRAFLDELKEARQVVKEAVAAAQTKDSRAANAASQTLKKLEADTAAELAERTTLASSLRAPSVVKVGDVVELASMPGVPLTVLEIDGDDVTLSRGAMRTRAPRDQLRVPDDKDKARKAARNGAPRKGHAPKAPPAAGGPDPRSSDISLDVRGQRADDALELLDAFLDKLLRQGKRTGYVLHGHGGGALKKAVRGHLGRSRYVKAHGPGSIDDGGDGWTVVDLNPDARI